MPRVQGDSTSWKKHTPDVPGVSCCAPQIKSAGEFSTPQIVAPQAPSVVVQLAAAQCGVDEPLTAQIYANPFGPPVVLPSLNGISLVPGSPNRIDVDLDTSLADGEFLLEITNDCGCCTLVTGAVLLG